MVSCSHNILSFRLIPHCGEKHQEVFKTISSLLLKNPLGLIFWVPTVHGCGNCGNLPFPRKENILGKFIFPSRKILFFYLGNIFLPAGKYSSHQDLCYSLNDGPARKSVTNTFVQVSFHTLLLYRYIPKPCIYVSFCKIF